MTSATSNWDDKGGDDKGDGSIYRSDQPEYGPVPILFGTANAWRRPVDLGRRYAAAVVARECQFGGDGRWRDAMRDAISRRRAGEKPGRRRQQSGALTTAQREGTRSAETRSSRAVAYDFFAAARSSASFSFAKWASSSSSVAQPIRKKHSISCVRFVGWRPVHRLISRQAMIAQYV